MITLIASVVTFRSSSIPWKNLLITSLYAVNLPNNLLHSSKELDCIISVDNMNATNALIVGSVGLIAVLLWRSRRRSNSSLLGKSLISIYDLTNNEIMEILKLAKYQKGFRCAQEYKSKCRFANLYCRLFYRHELHSKVVGLLFMEPSTRTRCSFESAAKRLGCSTVSVCDVRNARLIKISMFVTLNQATTSSIKKGETIEDTARMLQGYCDALVIRHPQEVGN